jgi:hypothetical protein
MYELFKDLLLYLRLQLALFDLVDLLDGPADQFLNLLPPMLHRFGIKDNYDESVVVFLDGGGKTRAGSRGDTCLETRVTML